MNFVWKFGPEVRKVLLCRFEVNFGSTDTIFMNKSDYEQFQNVLHVL
jgi:hypothetical protein